jgi:hypothetical protein
VQVVLGGWGVAAPPVLVGVLDVFEGLGAHLLPLQRERAQQECVCLFLRVSADFPDLGIRRPERPLQVRVEGRYARVRGRMSSCSTWCASSSSAPEAASSPCSEHMASP